MYDKRIKIFIVLCAIPFAAAIARLAHIQLVSNEQYRQKVSDLQLNKTKLLKTVRGRIVDRNNAAIASNEVHFALCVNYNLTRLADERFWQSEMLKYYERDKSLKMDEFLKKFGYERKRASLQDLIYKCTNFYGMSKTELDERLKKVNDDIWNQRCFVAWYRNCMNSQLRRDYDGGAASVDLAAAMADFEIQYPDESKRLALIGEVSDLAEMRKKWPVLEFSSDEEIFSAQLEFTDPNNTEVQPMEFRTYPFGDTASQLIGWVGYPQDRDLKLFADDRRARYLSNETCGHAGIEYICEPMLRGRRGEELYTFDGKQTVGRTETEPGQDVQLTLDIDLQKNIENMLTDCGANPRCTSPMAAVVIDVASSDILVLASVPTIDSSQIRKHYNELIKDPNGPLVSRAINAQYPPGSVIKPIIGIAALEEQVITPDTVISCPSRHLDAPNCWRVLDFGIGHDLQWSNCLRNAIKGSCNIYFSRVAERLSSSQIQKWLLKFGYGTPVLQEQCLQVNDSNETSQIRVFDQVRGTIASTPQIDSNSLPPITSNERRFFGIGQGSLRVTPLQVANAMAAISRGGIYRPPHLFLTGRTDEYDGQSLDISPTTLAVIRDGMHAVTSETEGTAISEIQGQSFAYCGVKVYGKTGSTQAPEHAWFAGFAEDDQGHAIAFSILVESGKRGSKDAAPLARKIVQNCIDAGYLGKK